MSEWGCIAAGVIAGGLVIFVWWFGRQWLLSLFGLEVDESDWKELAEMADPEREKKDS